MARKLPFLRRFYARLRPAVEEATKDVELPPAGAFDATCSEGPGVQRLRIRVFQLEQGEVFARADRLKLALRIAKLESEMPL